MPVPPLTPTPTTRMTSAALRRTAAKVIEIAAAQDFTLLCTFHGSLAAVLLPSQTVPWNTENTEQLVRSVWQKC